LVADPVRVKVSVRPDVVGPVLVKVNVPVSGPTSDALASVAATVTSGGVNVETVLKEADVVEVKPVAEACSV
jgi:hypothetical protein